jgi:hypothetical protein
MGNIDPRLSEVVAAQPYPLVFATVSGAHLYGFPSPDSDYDLRGTHLLPAREVLGLHPTRDTIETSRNENGLDLDLVTHDIRKFLGLMLKKNGYVLEQLYSPLIVFTTPEHEELKTLGKGCITRHHSHHYLGFTETQWNLLLKHDPPRIKPLLYVYRVLLTGIHLMRTGEVEANLLTLNREFRLPYIDDLVARKAQGPEKGTLTHADLAFHERERKRLETLLAEESQRSALPEAATARDALSNFLVRVRMKTAEETSR